jgi:hypothetical protein
MRQALQAATILVALAFDAQSPFATASAEYRGTPEQQRACTPDVYRYCAAEIPNVRAITRCLARNKSRLSPSCQAVFNGTSR